MTRSLDTRLGALERVYGVDDGPPIIVLVVDSRATEADPEVATRQAIERNPGQRIYIVRVARSEGRDGA